MAITSFFNILSAGYIKHYPDNRIFLDRYYTDKNDERQKYDLVFPRGVKGSLGLVLCIHGGGWVEENKDAYTSSLFRLTEDKGVGAACINYRYVSESVSYEDVLDDISSALAEIHAKGEKYGVNFDKVLLNGISAGGHLSLLYAYTRKETSPIKPVCVVELCGPTDLENTFFYSDQNRIGASVGVEYFRKIISNGIGFDIDLDDFDSARNSMKKYSPINYVDENTVPTVLGHGEIDDIVPYQNSLDLNAKLNKYNVKHTFISFPASNHECEDKKSMSSVMKLFFEYIDNYLK